MDTPMMEQPQPLPLDPLTPFNSMVVATKDIGTVLTAERKWNPARIRDLLLMLRLPVSTEFLQQTYQDLRQMMLQRWDA